MAGCDSSPQTPNTAQKNYPVIIKDSTDRRAKAEREWRRMLDAYSVQQTPPDFYPIFYTPRSLLGVTGGIQILPVKPEPGSEVIALREAMKGLQALEDSLPYQHHKKVREDIPVGVYDVIADFGQARGGNTATILPNESYLARRYGRTILLRANIMRDPNIFESTSS